MINKDYISKRLAALGFDPGVLNRYEEKHRFYHTIDHIVMVMSLLDKKQRLDDELFLVSVYHDAVYDPKSDDNEDKSARLFQKAAASSKISKEQVRTISQVILETRDHKASGEKSEHFMEADLNILDQPLREQIRQEHLIFKEYQFVDYKKYVPERIKVLEKINAGGRLNTLIEYVKLRRPLIGVFAGSFNPFHKGHYNILQKAENIFDKVIIAFGKNPEKDQRDWGIPKSVRYRQIETYDGLLTDFVDALAQEVVVIRGLRNSTDFQYEQNQYRYIQELMPEIRIINIFCDKEFEHISSSGIRTLEKYNRHHDYILD
jgi:pantetheine-phosphate adenylyltransferase